MKHKLCAIVLALTVTLSSALADAGIFRNEIVQSDDETLRIEVADRRFVRIVNFVQEAGAERGLVAVTTRNGKAAFVLTATSATEAETQKDFIVAGPATITVDPVADGKLFIAYRLSKNAD